MTVAGTSRQAAVGPDDRRTLTLRPMRHRRPFLVLLIALAVLLAADLSVQLLHSHLRQPQAWPTPELQNKFDQISGLAPAHRTTVVLAGDSLMDAGGNPLVVDALPGAVYNASLAGETLPVLSSWVDQVVVPRLHPRTIVLGFSINVLNANIPGEANLVGAYRHSRVVRYTEGSGDVLDRADGWLRDHVALYKYRTVLRDPFKGAAADSVYDPPLSPYGWNRGFAEARLATGPAALHQAALQVEASLLHNFAVSPARANQLGAWMAGLRRAGIGVDLVVMPVSPALLEAVPGGRSAYNAAVHDLLSAAVANGAHTDVADPLPAADFADAIHLNRAGANVLGDWLRTRVLVGK